MPFCRVRWPWSTPKSLRTCHASIQEPQHMLSRISDWRHQHFIPDTRDCVALICSDQKTTILFYDAVPHIFVFLYKLQELFNCVLWYCINCHHLLMLNKHITIRPHIQPSLNSCVSKQLCHKSAKLVSRLSPNNLMASFGFLAFCSSPLTSLSVAATSD